MREYADVLLPIAPFTETAGTFVNAEGTVQTFNGVVRPFGDTRPAWKVLRVLGSLLGVPGFEYDTSEEVRAAALGDGELDVASVEQDERCACSWQGHEGGGRQFRTHRRRADLSRRFTGAPR